MEAAWFFLMGFLRIYLALCVISTHTSAIFFGFEHGGDQAVQIFFSVSGFYMALVLTESYSSTTKFFISRAIRIYVPYLVILLFICLVSGLSGLTSGRWFALEAYAHSPLTHNGMAGVALAAVSNVSIFFQDWLMFLKHDFGQHLQFTTNYAESKSALWHYMIIPPSWSVALELCFYAMAPFLNRLRTVHLVLIIAASTGLRTCLFNECHLNFDPWTYRFFPCEISTFLIGMLGYRIYTHFKGKGLPCDISICWFYGVLLCAFLIYAWIIRKADSLGVISYLTFFPLMLIIPVLFSYSQKSTFDRFIGELSFPVYLLHWHIIPLGMAVIGAARWNPGCLGPLVALGSIGGAILVLKLLILPLEEWRRSFKQQALQPAFPRK
jgi:peptidoglycan/LPS O-acetylase OafA/YrhL